MKKFLSFILVAALVFVTVLSGCSKKPTTDGVATPSNAVPINVHKTFESLYGGSESYLYNNPDRGFRTEFPLSIEYKKPVDQLYYHGVEAHTIYLEDDDQTAREKIEYLWNIYFSTSYMDCPNKGVLLYLGVPDFAKEKVLPQRFFEILDIYFQICREKGVKCLFRLSYHVFKPTVDCWGEEYEKELVKRCADEETMLGHIEQLAPVIERNKDAIHKISSGFIGTGGEMVAVYQNPPVNFNTIMKAIVEKWCVPNGIYYTVRLPKYKFDFMDAEPDWPYFNYIGYNNDAIYGEQTTPNKHSGCLQKDHTGTREEEQCTASTHYPNDWWERVCEIAAYTPQSGEIYVNSHFYAETTPRNHFPDGKEVILECAHFRYTTMSQYHTLGETRGDSVMAHWIKNETVTPEWCEENNIVYDPAWFVNSDGETFRRNPFDFIRDHLGYKVVAQSVDINGKVGSGAAITVSTKLKNYGFSAAFNMMSGYAILDENFNLVSKVQAGDPEKWYSHDPDNYISDEVLEHEVKAEVTLPTKSGRYYVAFYLMNSGNTGAALSNSNIDFQNGYNILYGLEF